MAELARRAFLALFAWHPLFPSMLASMTPWTAERAHHGKNAYHQHVFALPHDFDAGHILKIRDYLRSLQLSIHTLIFSEPAYQLWQLLEPDLAARDPLVRAFNYKQQQGLSRVGGSWLLVETLPLADRETLLAKIRSDIDAAMAQHARALNEWAASWPV